MWDRIPEEMQLYLSRNGKHFNKKLSDFAASKMRAKDSNGEPIKFKPYTRDEVDTMLQSISKSLDDFDAPYDIVYLANMAKADFAGTCLQTPEQIAQFANDIATDVDGYDGMVLNRWLADMAGKSVWIDWERMI